MPNANLAGQRDIEAKIENLLTVPVSGAAGAVRSLFVEGLDFQAANGAMTLHGPHLPASASLVARRDGVNVVVAVLPDAEMIRVAAIRAAMEQCARELGPDLVLVVADARGDEWQIVTQKPTAGRDLLRRMVIRPRDYRTVIEQLDDLWRKLDARTDLRKAFDEAYDVEPVRKRFFSEYKRVFEATMAALAQTVPQETQRRLFCQRLFNRLLFIRFLEKRGWLRFPAGDAHLDYLRRLWADYTAAREPDGNFYRDRLRLLFFYGLNNPDAPDTNTYKTDRGDTVARWIGSVPYLNGGLFDTAPDDEADVPDAVFGPIMHDVLYRFNFTVTEATPLDVEVAVDPEMLGKVFEELVTGRHESGSYYTPKPIVAFMCREALKGYLETRVPTESPAAIARFVDDHDAQFLTKDREIDDVLVDVRVCDPACGSGAYLLGMLHELFDLRKCIYSARQKDPLKDWEHKLAIIQNNVYGVDLSPFATEIARLRLWLSLTVEYEGDEPRPLPNLEYKIGTGDSLTAPNPNPTGQTILGKDQIEEFWQMTARYLRTHGSEKAQLRAEIEDVRDALAKVIHMGVEVHGFDWRVDFAEVFAAGGFDIVLANPPYVRMELFKDIKPVLRRNFALIHNERADLYCYFYARALELLRPGGMLTFISSNKWLRAAYGADLRTCISETCDVGSITDFGDLPVFEGASAYPMIFVAQKKNNVRRQTRPVISTILTQPRSLTDPYPNIRALVEEQGQSLPSGALNGATWSLSDVATADRIRHMASTGVALGEYAKRQIYRGVASGLNAAFVIDNATRERLIAENEKSADIIKPLVSGKDIQRWHVKSRNNWLLYMYHGVNVSDLPAVLEHLQPFKRRLEERATEQEWYELQQPQMRYIPAFSQPKIVFPDIAKGCRFAFDTGKSYLSNTAYLIGNGEYYLLGVLNSSSVEDFYVQISAQVRGGYLRFIRQYVEQIPIPNAPAADRNAIADLVQRCLDARGVGCGEWEAEIDARVAALYGVGT